MALMILLFVFVPYLNSGMVGIMIPVSMIVTLIFARYRYNKERLAAAPAEIPAEDEESEK